MIDVELYCVVASAFSALTHSNLLRFDIATSDPIKNSTRPNCLFMNEWLRMTFKFLWFALSSVNYSQPHLRAFNVTSDLDHLKELSRH